MSNRMGKAALLLVAFMLVGCEPETKESSRKFDIPPALSDCRFYDMNDTNVRRVLVVRCPHSDTSTSYRSGKSDYRTVTIDD